jgi:hypothetical protein
MRTIQHRIAKRPPRDLSGLSFAFFGTFAYWPSYHPGTPEQVARQLGATIRRKVDEDLDYIVFGDRRGSGRAEARKQAEKLRARAQKAGKKGKAHVRPEILDEAAFREMVQMNVSGRSFAFVGAFDCSPSGFEDGLLTRMVEAAGGGVRSDVDEQLDYLVVGNRRAPGKLTAQRRAEELRAAGCKVQTLNEEGFLELVRTEQPKQMQKAMDFATFISQLYGTVDQGKRGRALKMLKAESFKLFVDLRADRLVGVVRSQTGSGTVYASWLTPEGRYGCSTPELQDCMGLQGSPCKHLLVLLVGLVRTGNMEASAAYSWIHATVGKGPRTDNELAAETFLQYKGAQAGEIDWRPMETIPEDYYAF